MTQTELRPNDADDATAPDQGCACAGGCGSRSRSVTRRAAIGAGVVTGAALLAACGSSDTATTSTSSTSSSPSSSSTSSSSSSSAPASSSSSSAPSSESSESEASESESSSAGSAAPSGTEIAKVADVPAGGSLVVANGDEQIALAKNADGTVVAYSAICTHQGCTVKADGASLSCPCHGSTFDAFTGAATKAPATKPLATIAVEVTGDAVYLTA